MAVRKTDYSEDSIVITVPFVTLTSVRVHAPKAAERLKTVPSDVRKELLAELLEYGADAFDTAMTSTTLQLLEKQIGGFEEQLAKGLEDALGLDRSELTKQVGEILRAHETRVAATFTKYLDPQSTEGVQETVAKRIEAIGRDIEKRVRRLLDDGEDGALAAVVGELRSEIRDAVAEIVKQIGARQALKTKSALSGRPYELAVADKLTRLSQATGDRLEHVGDSLGVSKRKIGDILIYIDPDVSNNEDVRVVVEAKRRDPGSQGFSIKAITKELA